METGCSIGMRICKIAVIAFHHPGKQNSKGGQSNQWTKHHFIHGFLVAAVPVKADVSMRGHAGSELEGRIDS